MGNILQSLIPPTFYIPANWSETLMTVNDKMNKIA